MSDINSDSIPLKWYKNYSDLAGEENIILGIGDGKHVQILDQNVKPRSILILETSDNAWNVFKELNESTNCSLEMLIFKTEKELLNSGFIEEIVLAGLPILPYRPAWNTNYEKYNSYFEVLTGRSQKYALEKFDFLQDENITGASKLIGELLR